jgi:bifunctional non-homologous end joining protein LigD
LLNLFRCREGQCFFQRNREHPPTGKEFDTLVELEAVTQKNGRTEEYLYVETEDQLIACAKVQSVEFHGWGSRAGAVETPDRLVIDLDPDPALGFAAVNTAAFQLRRSLHAIGLASFPLLTGGKGIHVVVPLDATADWPAVKSFAERLSRAVSEAEPEMFTANIRKVQRKGRIFLDWLRNQRGATAVLPYSARAREGAPVAAPIAWEELDEYEGGNHFTIRDADELIDRASSKLLAGWGQHKQALPEL